MSEPRIVMTFPPPVVFLDTDECRAVAEYVTQRPVRQLKGKYRRLGLKIRYVPGESENAEKAKHGLRPCIVVSEWVELIKTITE